MNLFIITLVIFSVVCFAAVVGFFKSSKPESSEEIKEEVKEVVEEVKKTQPKKKKYYPKKKKQEGK